MQLAGERKVLLLRKGAKKMYVKPQIKKLNTYIPGKSTGGVKLSSNENPFGASANVNDAIANFKDFACYPDAGAVTLKENVSELLKINTKQLTFGAGADEIIQMISRSVLASGDNIIQANSTFPQYEHHAIIEGSDVIKIPLKNGVHDLNGMLAAIDDKTKIVWICNPNNPTGTYVNEDSLKKFLESVPSEVLVVVDEAYVEYVVAEDFPNTIELMDQYLNLVVLRTFSKVYGLASFRVGFGIGNEEFIQDLEIARLPFSIGALAQEVAVAALTDQDFVARSVALNSAGLAQYVDFFDANDIMYYPSQANFIFIPCSYELGMRIDAKLVEAGYIVRLLPLGVRITIGTKSDNEGVIACLKANLKLLH